MESALKFKIGLEDFKAILNQMKFVYVGKRSKKRLINCKVTIQDGEVEFEGHGYMFRHKVKCKGGAQFSVPFTQLQLIASTSREPDIVFIVKEGSVQINFTTLKTTTTFFRNPNSMRKINLSVNSTDKELLQLPYLGYTKAEITHNKLTPKIRRAKARLEENISQAFYILEVYGVTIDEIEELVESKLYGVFEDEQTED